MTDSSKHQIYPRYCFHLAPTVNTWCLFRVVDVHGLDQHEGFEGELLYLIPYRALITDLTRGENFYFYRNLPIKWVRIVGVVVAIDEFAGRRVYTVDDSSGACIECVVLISTPGEGTDNAVMATESAPKKVDANPLPSPALLADIDVGTVVDVKGSISTFREERQLNIEKMIALRSTAQEVALWEKRIKFQSEVLEQPWALRNRDIRRCRKEAERSEEEAERKQKRIKAMIESRVAKQPPARSEDQEQRSDKQQQQRPPPSKTARLDLRQILEHGRRGKYDALGL
ncbi:ob-fold nucleic acid [Fusarium albosuccineum]|uniref:CST complex subunit STN1 n=1 Tax=Fusarium albosuccineum TaxID=1237068 RepID=A0A8H4PBC6_9HYPO|nr:ob-fold nucleic acid [Fusarium albosuccineum]